jgi:glycosyltransferase involved in cell wall biosynthesis
MSTRPVIAFVVNVVAPYREHVLRRIVREIPEIELHTLITHDQPDQPWAPRAMAEINPVRFGAGQPVVETAARKWMKRDWAKGGEIVRWLKDRRAAAVVCVGYNDLTRARILAWCPRHGVPILMAGDSNIRGDLATGAKRTAKNVLVRWVVGRCSGVMPCGRLGAEYFQRYGARPETTFFHPYEPDYNAIRSIDPATLASAADKHRLEHGRRRLVISARLVPVKRVDLAIDAFARIADERADWDLVVVGDGPLKAELQQRVPATLRERVRWTGFVGDTAEIAAIYRSGDILLCPSDYEPWAVVVNEAAAAGLAIVATDVVAAAHELVEPAVNGEIVPAGDLNALTAALRRCTDPSAIDRLKAGSARVLERWRQVADPVEGLRRALQALGVLPGLAQADR